MSDEIVIDFQQGEALPGDIFILSSDGLTAHVSDSEIEAAAVEAAPKAACEALLAQVLSRGGTDNVTIILVKVKDQHDDALPGPASFTREGWRR